MITGGYERDSAEQALASRRGHLIGVGRAFITNPDYVQRLWYGRELAEHKKFRRFYGGDDKQYTDWPTWEEEQAKKNWPAAQVKNDAKL
jgi:N-ethylmaleimide reductase